MDSYRSLFESRISAGAAEKLPETKATEKSDPEAISSWSYDMEGYAKKYVERYCELVNKTTEQLIIHDHQFKEEENGSVGELSKVCSQIVLTCLYFARIGRPDKFYGLWTNLLVRWRFGQKHEANVWHVWSLTFITHVNTGNIVLWETQHSNVNLDYSKTLIWQETFKTQSPHQVEVCASSEAEHLCQ